MSGEKTEQPTPKKLQDSRKKGDVPYSRDFTQTLLTLALLCYLLWRGPGVLRQFGQILLIPPQVAHMEFRGALRAAFEAALRQSLDLMWPFLAIVLGVGIFVELVQIGVVVAVEKIKPSGKKLNVVSNAKNIVSMRNVVEVLKSMVKIVCLSVLVMTLLRDGLDPLVQAVPAGMKALFDVIKQLFTVLVLYTAVFCLAIAGFDMGWQRWQRRKRLMMTKQEVTREHKDMEGQPEIKHTRKRLHQELANSGATQAARKASTLVVNPTHVAVALWYEPDVTPLPVVLAKGRDRVALDMIDAARQAGVPVMRDVPLARALLADARENEYIPSELVVPVAKVLRIVRDFVSEGREPPAEFTRSGYSE